MMSTRRAFLVAAAAAPLLAKRPAGLKIGTMDGVLRLSGKPEAVAAAKRLGLAGVQVTLGRPAANADSLPLEDPELQRRYIAASREHKLPLDATYLDVLHTNCLKNDALAPKWIRKGIEITKKLDAKILMTVFFGKCALAPADFDTVAGAFRELAPEAERAGVILGFENLLSAEDNARIQDQVGSKAFKIYYDVGNSTNMGGFDVPKEIRFLGRGRICQFHFKDKGYLGEGKVDYPAILAAIADIGFDGYANLETSAPSGDVEADVRRNLSYLEKVR